MDTKQKIRSVALELFSMLGFQAVSIRDICALVGVKESTIYFHYKNKQDIFNCLLTDVRSIMEAMKARFMNEFHQIDHVTEEAFTAVALHYYHSFFLSDPTAKFINMLSIERMSNPEAAEIYRELVFDIPLEHQTMVFQQMRDKGLFVVHDAAMLAKEYHYAVFGTFMNGASDKELAVLIQGIYRREIVR